MAGRRLVVVSVFYVWGPSARPTRVSTSSEYDVRPDTKTGQETREGVRKRGPEVSP